jgi:hypothetical protein
VEVRPVHVRGCEVWPFHNRGGVNGK